MNPLDQFKNINTSQKAIEAAMGSIANLDWVNEMTKRIQYPTNIATFGGALDILKSMHQHPGIESMNSISKVASGIAPLLDWYKDNPLKNQMDGIISNHALLNQRLSSLSSLSSMYAENYVKPLNAMEVALRGISTDFLKNISFDDLDVAEEEYDLVEEVTEVIASQAKVLQVTPSNYVSIEVFQQYQNQVLEELIAIKNKTKSEKVISFVNNLMGIISFIVMIFTLYGDSQKLSNKELLEKFRNETVATQKKTEIKLDKILKEITRQRRATTNVNLRISNKKRAAKKGLVKKGQSVSVIETLHKYLLIYYIDNETGEPKTGYVYKKYFEKID
ncbi:hypothetical protein [Nonlabens agnitus]|uniref:Uncharacterized protein n=1 Tax=Nonlabens agnitus TaxID=870484 RepID=A0A2S9WRE5_9FLAO|nr:hypothetical protein [Nonlabens agnitus]PRP65856.1 hypothetical protein BST86_01500 [Nonlabens agnitus]